MMLRLVFPGSRREDGEGTVENVWEATFIEGAEGFMGMGALGRFWERYQAKILWPNFWGLELAPATAMRGEDMKVRAAVCMFVVVFVGVLSGVVVEFRRFCDLVVAGISGRFFLIDLAPLSGWGSLYSLVRVCFREEMGYDCR